MKFLAGSSDVSLWVQFQAMVVLSDRAEVRRHGREARRNLTDTERVNATTRLVAHLQHLDALAAPRVGAFIAHDGEPDLMPLIESVWRRAGTVALPVLEDDPRDFSMRFVPWHNGDLLGSGRYDIPVPPSAPSIQPETLLVSLTAFDAAGRRMGRGAGFFDRYLASYNGVVVGVGFECQRCQEVPVQAHDQLLPIIVTDLGVRFVS